MIYSELSSKIETALKYAIIDDQNGEHFRVLTSRSSESCLYKIMLTPVTVGSESKLDIDSEYN